MGGLGAGDLARVLARFHQRQRIGLQRRLAAGLAERLDQREGRRRLVEREGLAGAGFGFDGGDKPGGIVQGRQRREPFGDRRRQLFGVGEQAGGAVARDEGEGERQRRVGDIAAADVEHPGEIVGVADKQGVGLQPGAQAGEFGVGALAGETQRADGKGGARRGGAVGPEGVDGVFDRSEAGA